MGTLIIRWVNFSARHSRYGHLVTSYVNKFIFRMSSSSNFMKILLRNIGKHGPDFLQNVILAQKEFRVVATKIVGSGFHLGAHIGPIGILVSGSVSVQVL